MNYTFGPVVSRRFGKSLGIDLSPKTKSCNFDCLYCELTKTKKVDVIKDAPSIDDILDSVNLALKNHLDIEVIAITANGEPTLYPYLLELIDRLNSIKNSKKLLILSNGSNLANQNVFNALKKIDIVKLSLDCATSKCLKKIDRPLKEINSKEQIEQFIAFRKEFKNQLIIEVLVVDGINDKINEFDKLYKALKKINPDRVDIGTIDRPPAYNIKAVNYKKLEFLCERLKDLPYDIVARKKVDEAKSYFSKDEILTTFAKRPFTKEDIKTLFDKKSVENLDLLIKSNNITLKTLNGQEFYCIITKNIRE